MLYLRYILLFLGLYLCFQCTSPHPSEDIPSIDHTPYHLDLPKGFPTPDIPKNNALTQSRVALGRRLFFDPSLSKDSSIACVSCHLPALAFTDGKVKSPGVHGRIGRRNTPSLFNLAYAKNVNRDGGVPKLDLQAMVPIEDRMEMADQIDSVAFRLNKDSSYRHAFYRAYGTPADDFSITRALGSFIRTLISGDSPYDAYQAGDTTAMRPLALAGQKLFFSERLGCTNCHSGFNFTDNSFANNALYVEYPDKGRSRVTIDTADAGKYRVPSLRNVALTAPYMHDGSLPDLASVIAHYASGGADHPNRDDRLQQFSLQPEEEKALLAFLESLTGNSFNISSAGGGGRRPEVE